MKAITYEHLCVETAAGEIKVYQLKTVVQANQHAFASLSGTFEKNNDKVNLLSLLEGCVKIYILDEKGNKGQEPFFSGKPMDCQIDEEDDYYVVRMELRSYSVLLDEHKKNQSYQDMSMTYSAVVKRAIADVSGAMTIATAGVKETPEKPLIQYSETDWQFALRLASQVGGCLVPDVKQPYPRFWFGMPRANKTAVFDNREFSCGYSKKFYELSNHALPQEEFIYYKVKSFEDFNIGDKAEFRKGQYIIYRKETTLVEEELVFTYWLGYSCQTMMEPYWNENICGLSLLGKVIETKAETVKIHLDIDKEQDVGKAYPYEWAPDSGSVMYCMPKLGTKISLYFLSQQEESARAVNCIRENGGTCAKFSNTADRCLSTEHGKEMYFKESTIGFVSETGENQVNIEDGIALTMDSSTQINLVAKGQVKVEAKKVTLQTPKELLMLKM